MTSGIYLACVIHASIRMQEGEMCIKDMSFDKFTEYMTMVAVDHRENGNEATADDYQEAVGRLLRCKRQLILSGHREASFQ